MLRIGIDVGGSSAKLGLVDASGAVVRRAQVPTGAEVEAAWLVERLAESARDLLGDGHTAGLGLAAPGMRREDGEGVINVTNLPSLDGFPLRARLEGATGLQVVIENDANAAALGEARFGAGRDARRLLVVTVGTGIGAGMVVDGAVFRVACQGLGDPGHVIVRPGGPRCGCGGRGCAETLASVPAIVSRADELVGPGPVYADFPAVIGGARSGERAAVRALEEAGHYLGVALATLTHLLAPDRILLGGGGMDAAEELLMEPARRALFQHAQPFLTDQLTLERAALGNDAGLVGAAALA